MPGGTPIASRIAFAWGMNPAIDQADEHGADSTYLFSLYCKEISVTSGREL